MIKLREMRIRKGMTQTELARKIRHADPTADQTMVSILERGDIYPGEKVLAAICAALDCTSAELYDGIESFFIPGMERPVSDTTRLLGEIFAECATYIPRHELRQLLTYRTGREVPDRTMRKIIETARREGMIIANDQDGYGYYLPTTEKQLTDLYKQNEHRALAILSQQKPIMAAIRTVRGEENGH